MTSHHLSLLGCALPFLEGDRHTPIARAGRQACDHPAEGHVACRRGAWASSDPANPPTTCLLGGKSAGQARAPGQPSQKAEV